MIVDRQTLEGIVLELDVALDSVEQGDVDFEAFHDRVCLLHKRLQFMLDNTPTD